MYWILFIGIAILSFIVQQSLQSKFKKYSQVPMTNGMTGKEVAEKMLRDHGITNVKVVSTSGMLTDHYNPANQTVNLSEGVYSSNSVAAAAVAAHECGHAVQHAYSYSWLKMRSALVPVVSFASNYVQWVIFLVINILLGQLLELHQPCFVCPIGLSYLKQLVGLFVHIELFVFGHLVYFQLFL